MYIDEQVKHYSHELKPHQKYFIMRWGELVDDGHIHFRNLLNPCLKAVIKEFIDVSDLFMEDILKDYNVLTMTDELIDIIRKNTVLKSFFQEDFSFLMKKIRALQSEMKGLNSQKDISEEKRHEIKKQKIKSINLLLVPFYHKQQDLAKKYVDYYADEISKESISFTNIDNFLLLLIPELIFEGYSKQYLHTWGAGVFLYDEEEETFLNKFKRIAELGKKNARNFECYFKVFLPKHKNYDFMYSQTGSVRFYQKPLEEYERLVDNSDVDGIEKREDIHSFFKEESQIAKVQVESVDSLTAIVLAQKELIKRLKAVSSVKSLGKYDPKIGEQVAVHDISGFQVKLLKKIESIEVEPHSIKLCNIEELLQDKVFVRLQRVLEWTRVIQDSPRETGLVAMWSLMEFLFASEKSEKRDNVVDSSAPFITHYWFKALTNRTLTLIQGNDSTRRKHQEEYIAYLNEFEANESQGIRILKKEKRIKPHYFLHKASSAFEDVTGKFKGNVLGQRYIAFLKSQLDKDGENLRLVKSILEIKKQIRSDLYRTYRLRNMLAHQARIQEDFLDEVYEKTFFYLQIILNDIFFILPSQDAININQVIEIKQESFSEYMTILSYIKVGTETGHLSLDDIRKIYFIKNLLI
jgi:hypothetical protein